MDSFEYGNPASLSEALAMLGSRWGDADVLAGGTDLISLMKDRLHTPRRVVNIKNVKELEGIRVAAAGLRIGALVTLDELARSPVVKAGYAALAEAAAGIPSPQIRHMGTAGGDLCQRPRCWYYRMGLGLLAMEDGKSRIVDGDNRYHSIFGGGPAYYVNPSSLAPALVAMGAKVRLVSARGPRDVDVANFFRIPQDEAAREIVLQPDEILTEILVPPAAGRSAAYEVRQKEALDWPLAASAVTLKMNGPLVVSARIVLGHVAPVPWDAAEAARSLAGKPLTAAAAEAAAALAVSGAQPLSQNAYKVTLARTAVKRALLAAANGKA